MPNPIHSTPVPASPLSPQCPASFADRRAIGEVVGVLTRHAAFSPQTGIGRYRLAAICHRTLSRFTPAQRIELLDMGVAAGLIARHRRGMGEHGARHECYTMPGVTPL